MAPILLLATLNAIVLSIMSWVWKAMHPLLGGITGFIGFFITFLIFGLISVAIESIGIKLEGMVFSIVLFIFSISFWLSVLRLIKRIKEDK